MQFPGFGGLIKFRLDHLNRLTRLMDADLHAVGSSSFVIPRLNLISLLALTDGPLAEHRDYSREACVVLTITDHAGRREGEPHQEQA